MNVVLSFLMMADLLKNHCFW